MLFAWFPPLRLAVTALIFPVLFGSACAAASFAHKQLGYIAYVMPYTVKTSDGISVCAHRLDVSGVTDCAAF